MSERNFMTAAILVEQKAPLEIAEIQLPDQLDVGQVLVRLHYSGICGSQLGEIDGVKGPDRFLPHLLGHEGSGEVLKTGPGVRCIEVGDHVVLHWRKGIGIEAVPPKYTWGDKTVNAGWVTTFNTQAVVAENRITKIPKSMDMKAAALMGCAVTTGFGVVLNNAKVKIGESVVVFGAGGIGLNIIQACKMVSASKIIAIDLHDNRLKLAQEMGATHTVNSRTSDPFNAIADILNGTPLDVFIDNTGQPNVIEKGYGLTAQAGRVILVGVPKAGDNINIYSLPLHFGKVLTGSHGGDAMPETDIPRYSAMFETGQLSLDPLVSKVVGLGDINSAISEMRDGTVAGRVLVSLGT